jgi:pimeloyl-ACP methyl ester carboxylesterase
MALVNVNDVHLYYERIGSGEPLVLVHGSWGDHSNWDALVPLLSERFDVVSYDRRGHSESERPSSQGSTDEDADDLAGLVEALDLAPAHFVTNSFGGVIALRLAAKRPELFRSANFHEPPAIPLLAEDPANGPMLQQIGERIGAVVGKLSAGEHESAAKQFVDEVAFGPGAWETELTDDLRAMFIRNAPTFLDEASDPRQLDLELDAVSAFERPVLLTDGDESPKFFPMIVVELVTKLPNAERRTIAGTGHVPQLTHPEQYAEVVSSFALAHS